MRLSNIFFCENSRSVSSDQGTRYEESYAQIWHQEYVILCELQPRLMLHEIYLLVEIFCIMNNIHTSIHPCKVESRGIGIIICLINEDFLMAG